MQISILANTTGNMEPSTSTTTLDDDAEAVSEHASVMPCDADVAKHCKCIQELKKNKYHPHGLRCMWDMGARSGKMISVI